MQDRTPRPTSLPGRAQKAPRQKGYRFRNLYGRLNEDCLKQGWRDICKEAAAGVDPGSAQAYEQPLDANIHDLVERLKQKRYRAKLVRRHYIPTGDGTQRPLGSPAVADKLLHLAVARLLEAMYEPDVLRWSYGYRPPVGALDAVDTLTIKRQCGRYAWVVEADIKKYFDTIAHEWRGRMLAKRIDNGARLRLIRKWLTAGGLDTDGQGLHPVTGTPQGGRCHPYWPLKWLKRRSPRHSDTWQGYPAVLERFPVARPRIVGRPKTRQAALKA